MEKWKVILILNCRQYNACKEGSLILAPVLLRKH